MCKKINYDYQEADWLYKSLTSTAPRNAFDKYPGELAIFTCKCGVDECGRLYCKVSETDNTVVWSDFHVTSNYEIYNSVQPLYFEKIKYKSELEQLKIIADDIKKSTPIPRSKSPKSTKRYNKQDGE